MNGATPITPGAFARSAASTVQSESGVTPRTVRCGTTPSTRSLSSRSKPFITDVTSTNTATLSTSPAIATTLMNEMKLLREFA